MASKATKKTKPAVGMVRIHVVPGAHVPGVPMVDQDVTPERAEELLAWGGPFNPAFTSEPKTEVEINEIRRGVLTEAEAEAAEAAADEPSPIPPDEGTEQPAEPADDADSPETTEV